MGQICREIAESGLRTMGHLLRQMEGVREVGLLREGSVEIDRHVENGGGDGWGVFAQT